jgi:electron transfer flavoprotein alpha/beta subunit
MRRRALHDRRVALVKPPAIVICVEPAALGPAARAALALALRLGPVTALAAGVAAEAPGLAEAGKLGVARTVLVVGDGLDGNDADALGAALATAARELRAALVLAGTRSPREGRGIVGAAVAHHLGASYLPGVEAVALGDGEDQVTVTLRGGGWRSRLAVTLPAVLTVPPLAVDQPRPGTTRPTLERLTAAPLARPRPPAPEIERPRHKTATVSSPGELIKRWRAP